MTKKLLKTNLVSDSNTQYVILYDSVSNLEELKQIIRKYNPQIITFNLESHYFLDENKIAHKLSEDYLNENELDSIQDHIYRFTQWYSNSSISKLIEYDGKNIGELFYVEFYLFLTPILKKFYEIMRIYNVFKNALFFPSNSLVMFLKLFSSNIQILNDNPTHKISIHDNVLKFKRKILSDNIKKILISQIIKISYGIFKIIFQNKKPKSNQQSIFLINHTTKRFQTVLEKLPNYPINLIKYDLIIPAFWDFESLRLIKNSHCYIEHSVTVSSNPTRETNSIFNEQLNNLLQEEKFFDEFFSLNNISFWKIIKNNFIQMYKRNYLNAIKNIEKIEFLFKKYTPSYVLTFSEFAPFELIIIKTAQKFNIKIGYLQHSMLVDDLNNSNSFGIKFSNFVRLLPSYSDHFLVWDKLTQTHALIHGVNSKKIIPIGCPFFDTFFHNDTNAENSKNEYILLAIDPFSGWNIRHFSTPLQIEYENTIKQICQITTKMNKKLLIKVHHGSSFNEKIAKKINPNIIVKYTGSFHDYVKKCELLICIDLSTAILDAMLLKKPIMSILIYDKDSPSEVFQNDYTVKTKMEDFEKTLTRSLDDEFKIFCIKQGEKFIHNYMLNHGTSAKSLLDFLSNLSIK